MQDSYFVSNQSNLNNDNYYQTCTNQSQIRQNIHKSCSNMQETSRRTIKTEFYTNGKTQVNFTLF